MTIVFIQDNILSTTVKRRVVYYKLHREFLGGGKEQVEINEDGLGVLLVNNEPISDVPVTVLEYVGTRRGYNCEIIVN